MNTFLHRDVRRQKLEEALVALGEAPHALREPIQAELVALQVDDWTVSDRTYLAVGEDWLWDVRLTLKMLVDDDPVLLALNQRALLGEEEAGAIEMLPRSPGRPPVGFLDQVRHALGGDEAILTELLHAGHRRWVVQSSDERHYPFEDVGVLLPLRLETLFDEPDSRYNDDPSRWKLSLRVLPDEASICRSNTHVSAGEVKAITDFWNGVRRSGLPVLHWLEGEQAEVTWRQLCARVTPARAAWLVANLETQLDDTRVNVLLPPDMPKEPLANRVGGVPPVLHVIAISNIDINGTAEHMVGRLPVNPDEQIRGEMLTLPLPATHDDERTRWWFDWEEAKRVGMAGDWLLPTGVTPQNIEALYVVGVGDEEPEAHFRAQVDAGELGVLRLGSPTNAVRGKAAADLGNDVEDWRKVAQIRLHQRVHPEQKVLRGAGEHLHRYLVGSASELPFFPGADNFETTRDSQRMVQALWPALWGHWLLDLWQVGADAHRVGSWMMEHFWPEGPLMPLRIGDQPYGVLPVTALSQWQSPPYFDQEAQAQLRMETAMASSLSELRSRWASAVKPSHSVVGKTTEQFMQLLGQNALSRRYIGREFSPAWVQLAPYSVLFGLDPDRQQAFLERARQMYELAIDQLGREPVEVYLTNGYWRRLALPLVQPTATTYYRGPNLEVEHFELPQLMLELFTGKSLDTLFGEEFRLRVLPDSLLIRLLIYATQQAASWRQSPMTAIQLNLAQIQETSTLDIARELDQENWRDVVIDEATGDIRTFTINVPDARRIELERALRATLDCAAHRIDPWITGFAWQRLKEQSLSSRCVHRLGVYGWVDGPFIGHPGPTQAGRLHTPSYGQTLTALILRDKFLTATRAGLENDGGRNPWEMNISSRKARLAEEIADEVRMGFHIYEIVGRHVENILGNHAGGPQIIKRLRTSKLAMRPERRDPNEVCNGIEVLQNYAQHKAQHYLQLSEEEADRIQLSPEQDSSLQVLSDALDTYGDLLMADGVMQLVNRQVERAAETMDAAAGFSRPPSFEFLRTPPSGYQLESVVLSTLPYVAPSTLRANASPIRIADPSVAAFIETQLGYEWVWTAHASDDNESVLGTVTLTELGFAPHETLALSADFLSELAQRKLGTEQANMRPPRQLAMARELVAALGNRPASGRDLSGDSTAQLTAYRQTYRELRSRYQRLHRNCKLLVSQLKAATNDRVRAGLLRRCLIWGVMPVSEPGDREAIHAHLLQIPIREGATPLSVLVERAAQILQNRLDDAPIPEELPSATEITFPLENHLQHKSEATPDGTASLAAAIANLASPNSRLAVLACWSRSRLLAQSLLVVDREEAALDENWLTVVAATRSPLARLEALQLEMSPPLKAWSNSLGDPWQQQLAAENLAQRDSAHEKLPGESALGLKTRRFVAAYGPAAAWSGIKVAVGMIDAFGEAIPMPQRTSTAAFGFNAPASRAPQAILLAVSPRPRQRLEPVLVQQIVSEARALAHARTARLEDVSEFQGLTPTTWLQSSGPERVHLEPHPLFD